MYNKIIKCSTKEQFKAIGDNIHTYRTNDFSDTTPLPADSWGFNETYQAAHVNSTTTSKRGGFSIFLGELKRGDTVRISAEFKVVSGELPRISMLNRDTDRVRHYIVDDKVGQFTTIDIEFVAIDDGEHQVSVGLTTSEIGVFHVRNIEIGISSKFNEKPPYQKDLMVFPITTTATGTFSLLTQYVHDKCTFEVLDDNVKIVFDKPFTGYGSSQNRSLVFISPRAGTTTLNYEIRAEISDWNHTGSQVVVRFYERGTNVTVKPETLPNGIYFDLLVVGYKMNY